jgi:surfactin synthase thioesterase subunit
MKRIVIFSHGFGVAKDSNGLFSDIAAALGPDIEPVLFDYNDIDQATNTMTVHSLAEQAKLLNEHITQLRQDHPGTPITLIGHSQGCMVAALAEPKVDQIILLAAPETLNLERSERSFADRVRPEHLPDGSIKITRRKGGTVIILPGFQSEIRSIDPPTRYNELAAHTPVTIIRAAQDEMLGQTVDDSHLDHSIGIVKLKGNHNFTDSSDRQDLITTINGLIG